MPEDSVLMYGPYYDEQANGPMQLRAADRYEETNYTRNKREGKRQVWMKDGTHYLMNYTNGKLHGAVTQTDADGTVTETIYDNGEKRSSRVVNDPKKKSVYATYGRLRKGMEDVIKAEGGEIILDRYFGVAAQDKTEITFYASKSVAVKGYHVLITYPRIYDRSNYNLANNVIKLSQSDRQVIMKEESKDPSMGYFYNKIGHYPGRYYTITFNAGGLETAYCKILVVAY